MTIAELERKNKMLRSELRRVSKNAKIGKGFYSDKIFEAFLQAINVSERCKKQYAEACTSPLIGEALNDEDSELQTDEHPDFILQNEGRD